MSRWGYGGRGDLQKCPRYQVTPSSVMEPVLPSGNTTSQEAVPPTTRTNETLTQTAVVRQGRKDHGVTSACAPPEPGPRLAATSERHV